MHSSFHTQLPFPSGAINIRFKYLAPDVQETIQQHFTEVIQPNDPIRTTSNLYFTFFHFYNSNNPIGSRYDRIDIEN